MLKRLYIYVLATVLLALPSFLAKADADSTRVVFAGDAFLKPLQKRDSMLIADQMKYGFRLDNVKAGTALALPDLSQGIRDSVEVVEGWSLDTLKFRKKKAEMDIEGSIVITSFDEGSYDLPPIAVMRTLPDGQTDTLFFKGLHLDVTTMPVDTATYKPHDIKAQMRYPVTFREILPYLLGGQLLAVLLILAVALYMIHRKKGME